MRFLPTVYASAALGLTPLVAICEDIDPRLLAGEVVTADVDRGDNATRRRETEYHCITFLAGCKPKPFGL